jgi:hypothetical protein
MHSHDWLKCTVFCAVVAVAVFSASPCLAGEARATRVAISDPEGVNSSQQEDKAERAAARKAQLEELKLACKAAPGHPACVKLAAADEKRKVARAKREIASIEKRAAVIREVRAAGSVKLPRAAQ